MVAAPPGPVALRHVRVARAVAEAPVDELAEEVGGLGAEAPQLVAVDAAQRRQASLPLVGEREEDAPGVRGVVPPLEETVGLGSADELVAMLEPLGVAVVVTRQGGELDAVRDALRDRTSVLVGHSGVGKSTLVNALVPSAKRAIGRVNAVTGRGRHTSSSTVSLRMRGADGRSGWIIDTPGVRSFGLGHVATASVLRGFPDLAEVAEDYPRGCTHLVSEEYCVLAIAAAEGRLERRRVDSMQRLLGTLVAARELRHQE